MDKTVRGKNRKLFFWIQNIWVVFLIAMILLFAFYAVMMMNLQLRTASKSMQDTLSVYAQTVDDSLREMETYLHLTFQSSEAVRGVEREDAQSAYAKQNVARAMSSLTGWSDSISQLMYCYPGKTQPVGIYSNGALSFADSQAVYRWFMDLCTNQQEIDRLLKSTYSFLHTAQSTCLVKLYKVNNSYFCVVVDEQKIYAGLQQLISSGVQIALLDQDRNVHCQSDTGLQLPDVLPQQNGEMLSADGKSYLVNSISLPYGGFYLYGLTQRDQIVAEALGNNLLWVFLTVLGFVLCYAVSVFLVDRKVVRPIVALTRQMGAFGSGDLDVHINTRSRIDELERMEHAFNDMTQEIQTLKIENYEIQLEKQRAQLQYLQMQVNPHFYLNALNVIYTLAQTHDYANIQKFAMHLVKYLRYMFHESTSLVTLRQELEHVDEFIEIQQMRFGSKILYTKQVDDTLLHALLPPFAIQSFVENAIKYAFKRNHESQIWLCATRNEQFLDLEIRDNGEGFAPEVIERINGTDKPAEDSERQIGIQNVKMRLSIIYGAKASLSLENDNGAVVRIRIPYIEV